MGAVIALLSIVVHGPVLTRGDFPLESWPAYAALMDGDVAGFWEASPGYLAFAIGIGAPATLLSDALGWGADSIYRLTAIPGAALLVAIGTHLARAAHSMSPRARWAVLLLGTGGPLSWLALHFGHAEDLLASAAAIAGVLAALSGRPLASSLLIAGAVAAKQWAVLAILPAVAVAPRDGLRILLVAGGAATAVVAAEYFLHPVAAGSMVSTGEVFHTRQLWYPLGLEPEAGTAPGLPGERLAPDWLKPLTHPLIVGLALPLTVAWRVQLGRRAVQPHDVFLLLGLLFMLRCLLDPWNVSYYHLPAALSLLAWEVLAGRRTPWLTGAVVAVVFLESLYWTRYNGPVAYVSYVIWAVPLTVWLGARALGLARPQRAVRRSRVEVPAAVPGRA